MFPQSMTSHAPQERGGVTIGIDIGGTKTKAVALGGQWQVLHVVEISTPRGGLALVETAVTAVKRLAELCKVSTIQLNAVGVGVPGTVDTATGHVQHAVNLGVTRLDLGNKLAQELGTRIRVDNDVKAAALGAYRILGLGNSMAYLNLGTGTAAGIVVNGRVLRGAKGAAGEIGHVPIDPDGAPCPCGQRGCLETVASGAGIARQWKTNDLLPARAILEAAADGDLIAGAIKARLINGIASAVRILVLTVDVNHVVLGGGLSLLGQPLLRDVYQLLDSWAERSPFLASLSLPHRVELLPEGNHAAAIGAALLGDE